jgi:hypothetical protein
MGVRCGEIGEIDMLKCVRGVPISMSSALLYPFSTSDSISIPTNVDVRLRA